MTIKRTDRTVYLVLSVLTITRFRGTRVAREILLSRGKVAIVDDADFEWLSRYRWCLLHTSHGDYGMRSEAPGHRCNRKVLMHREIMGFPDGEVDHKDRNGLNNQRSNLRVCSSEQNKWNTRRRKDNCSGYKGVGWSKCARKWVARIRFHRKCYHLGVFTDPAEAARVYDDAAQNLFGEFARLNFPPPESSVLDDGSIT